jgi:hypothetical protein
VCFDDLHFLGPPEKWFFTCKYNRFTIRLAHFTAIIKKIKPKNIGDPQGKIR